MAGNKRELALGEVNIGTSARSLEIGLVAMNDECFVACNGNVKFVVHTYKIGHVIVIYEFHIGNYKTLDTIAFILTLPYYL